MAFFKTVDFLKRNNAEVLVNIVSEKGMMTVGKKADGTKASVSGLRLQTNISPTKDELLAYCETVKGSPPELLVDEGWIPVTRFFKDSRFVPPARNKSAPAVRDKEFQQRQEKSLVEVINQWNQPIHIEGFEHKVSHASPAPYFGPHGKENLVDVVVWDERSFSYNVSCKMSHAADLGSGGFAGLQRTVPDLIGKIYYQVKYDLFGLGFEEGESYNVTNIPTLMYSIPYSYAVRMFQGCVEVGGPIDYLYVGPEKVEYKDGKLNGNFTPVELYAKKKPYYLRLRKRNVFNNTVKINFTKMNSYGMPCIFTSGAGDFAAARFVVDDRVPPKAIVRKL